MRFLALALLALAAYGQSMFDGKTLQGWKETEFAKHGKVTVEDGAIVLHPGAPLTGITWTGDFPKNNYEVRFEAMRKSGYDFFASFTFPVGESFCTFITGGWGGDIIGFSSIDGWDAADNETRAYFNFENGRWYSFRVKVTPDRLTAWIDAKEVVNVVITGRKISLRPGDTKLTAPAGFMSYDATGVLRKIEYSLLKP